MHTYTQYRRRIYSDGTAEAQACLGFLEPASLGNWQLLQLNRTDLCCQCWKLTSHPPSRMGSWSTHAVKNQNCHTPHLTPSLGTLILSCSPNLCVPYQAAKANPLPQAAQSSHANELRVTGTVTMSSWQCLPLCTPVVNIDWASCLLRTGVRGELH